MTAAEVDGVRLPASCPSWCSGEHEAALAEGCRPEIARVHHRGDLIGHSDRLPGEGDREHHRWHMWLYADPGPDCVFHGPPFIELEVRNVEGDLNHTMRLWPGDARSLARQLVHLADLAELEA
ncbi:hypothetical protein GCM10023340_36310 [Nocardioides marinquilinus]|uniref:Uncharacterized protein n=1 Tax=Nocardioides marinquilinus TaxID=1210400 RepID=A0ABP9PXV8_9ACTN